MKRLNYPRGIVRLAIVAYAVFVLSFIFWVACTPIAERPSLWETVGVVLGGVIMAGFGAFGLMIAWLIAAWIVDGFSN